MSGTPSPIGPTPVIPPTEEQQKAADIAQQLRDVYERAAQQIPGGY